MAPLERLRVTFTLGARDLRHLRAVAERASARAGQRPERELVAAARARAAEVRKFTPPSYVLERVGRLESLIELLEDPDWNPPETVRGRVRAALAYFTDPDDLIADAVPGLGFLDDAIVIELLWLELRDERAAFETFAQFRRRASANTAALAARRRTLRAQLERRERTPVVRRWLGR